MERLVGQLELDPGIASRLSDGTTLEEIATRVASNRKTALKQSRRRARKWR
jgi:hypothetical protein